MVKYYNAQQTNNKSRNWLILILIIVFILLCIGLIINTVRYIRSPSQLAVFEQIAETEANNFPSNFKDSSSEETLGETTEKVSEYGEKLKKVIKSSKSPQAIVMNLIALVLTGGSFWLLLFLKKFDQRNYYNISNSFTLISNNRFCYISLILGIIFAFYLGGFSLFKNVNIDVEILFEKSIFIQRIYAFLAVILLIENFIKTGFSIPIALARTGIFVTIGLTLIIIGYIIGTILFYIIVAWLVLKVVFGMIAAENRRREEQGRIDRMANSIVDAFERRWS
jgi:hypothetical protein